MTRNRGSPPTAHAARGGHGTGALRRRRPPAQDLLRGVARENPVLVQMLGLCPALAVTNTVANSLVMGLATFFVLFSSSLMVSSLKRLIPHEVRLTSYVLIIATFVTIVDMVLEAVVPHIHRALGAFVYLIVVNCMILGRQEAFASRQPVGRSLLDAAGTGFGFIIALLVMGSIREVIGSGSFLGHPVFGAAYEPWVIMVLPPGGFLTIGVVLLALNWLHGRRSARRRRAELPADAAAGRAA